MKVQVKFIPCIILMFLGACNTQEQGKTTAFEAINVYANPNTFEQHMGVLLPGDDAPRWSIEKWYNGEAVERFEKGKVYVVEFFASWCQPCRKSIPHLARLQQAFSDDLRVIGIAASEADSTSHKLEAFMDKYKDVLTYQVGYTQDERTFKDWMWGARNTGLPWVFIVDRKGKIAWYGQPFFSRFEPVLRSVIEKTYDPENAALQATQTNNTRRELWEIQEKFWTAYDKEVWPEAFSHSQVLFESQDESFYYEVVKQFDILYLHLNQKKQAIELGRELFTGFVKDIPEGLASIATTISEDPYADKAHILLALEVAKRLNSLTYYESAESLFLLGKLFLMSENVVDGKRWLESALALSDDPQLTSQIVEMLDTNL